MHKLSIKFFIRSKLLMLTLLSLMFSASLHSQILFPEASSSPTGTTQPSAVGGNAQLPFSRPLVKADTEIKPVGMAQTFIGSKEPSYSLVSNDFKIEQNEFQRFVQSSTGQALHLYGYELFSKPGSFAPVQAAPVPAGYILGPGDELVLQVNGLAEFSQNLVIDRDGRVLIPKVGPLNLAGVAFSSVEKVIAFHIGKVYRNFSLSVTMGRLRSIEVFVTGQARQPGKHLVSSLSSLINALFETGGPSSNGSLRAVELRRAGKRIASVDLYAFFSHGDNSADVQLMSGDIIFIPPAGPRVAVLGVVNAPAIYELRGSESIKQILGLSGGLPALATPKKAQLERLDVSLQIARYVEDLILDSKGMDEVLKAGDILRVLPISAQIANVVTLRGSVAVPMRYAFKPGMRISDLIPDVNALIHEDFYKRRNFIVQNNVAQKPQDNFTSTRGNPDHLLRGKQTQDDLTGVKSSPKSLKAGNQIQDESRDSTTNAESSHAGMQINAQRAITSVKNMLDEINWDYAVIERLDAKEVRSTLIPFNLAKAIKDKDPANDLILLPGDVVTVFNVNELPVAAERRTQHVSITGEVMAPGVYQIRAGETLPQLIQRAGGLSKNAFTYGMVFSRESTRLQQQDNMNKAVRRLESDIYSQSALGGGNSLGSEKAPSDQTQITGQRILLSRIKELKANGRIALELDPVNPVLPPIYLEDGDQITVPQQPSFVTVFGEVFAENSFIHKTGNTVGDYLNKAGLTRDADKDNLLIIRADGTIEGNGSSFWSMRLTGKKVGPGDSIFVPSVLDRRSLSTRFIEGTKDWTMILSQFGLSAAAIKALSQ